MILEFSLIMLLLSVALMVLNFFACVGPGQKREKMSTFECGFDPKSFSRLPFSMHFFLIALIFLIFDVEISLLIPLPMSWGVLFQPLTAWLMLAVLLILLLGTLIEWLEESLQWHI